VWDDYPDRGLYTCRMTRRGVAVSGLQWKSAAFSGLVAQKRYTLFLRSSFRFACDDVSGVRFSDTSRR
jgi:hypothetical protein